MGRWTITCKQRGECACDLTTDYIHIQCVCGMDGIPARRKPQDYTYNHLQSQNILFSDSEEDPVRSSAGKRATSLSVHFSGLGDNRSHSHGGVCNKLLSPNATECLNTQSPGWAPYHRAPYNHTYWEREGGPKHQELVPLLASVLTATGLHHTTQIHRHQQTFPWETLGNVKAQNVRIHVTVYALIRFHYRVLNQKLGSGLTVSLAQLFLLLNQVCLTRVSYLTAQGVGRPTILSADRETPSGQQLCSQHRVLWLLA